MSRRPPFGSLAWVAPVLMVLGCGGETQPPPSTGELEIVRLAAELASADVSVPPGPANDAPRAEGDDLWLPFSTSVAVALDLPADAELRHEGVEIRGDGRLEVRAIRDGSDRDDHTGWPSSSGPASVSLGSGGLTLLRLDAVGGDGGVVVRRPRVVAASARPPEPPAPPPPRIADRRDLVLFVVDTLRADRLDGSSDRPATPHLDRFAAESVVFERMRAQSSWTRSSMATVLTGKWPLEHGAVRRRQRLEDEAATLAELLREAGWSTAGFVTNANLSSNFGFDQGFETFEYLGEKVTSGEALDRVERFLADRPEDGRPLLLWVHVIDPHAPYAPPDEVRRRLAPGVDAETARRSRRILSSMGSGRASIDPETVDALWALYDAEVTYTDERFGALLERLPALGLDDAVVAFLSDHGEEFAEHGHFQHGRTLFEESILVPWMIRAPGLEPRRVDREAQHLDVLPTLLDLLGVDPPPGIEGWSWVRGDPPERTIFSHIHLDGGERMSATDGRFKLLAGIEDGRVASTRLYDLHSDPGETVDVSADHPVRTAWLARQLRRRLAGPRVDAADAVIDEQVQRDLEALGYL